MRAANPSRLRGTVLRVCIAGGMAGVFVLVAMLAEPRWSSASQGIALPDGIDAPTRASTDLQGLLGEMRGREYIIEVVAGPEGPTYRVLTGDRRVIAEGLRADEVYTVDEHLTVDRFGDTPGAPLGGPLMLLEPGSRE